MRALISIALFALVVVIYFWKVRPLLKLHPNFAPFFDLADTYRGRVWAWLKLQWGLALATASFVLPELPDLFTQLTGLDFTAFGPSPFWHGVAQAVGLAAIVAKFAVLRRTVDR
jgi:hypothetical protein